MKAGRPGHEKTQEHVHHVRITLSSKNVKNLEKVCAELVSGAKNKGLKANGDDRMLETALPITTSFSPNGGRTATPPLRNQRPSKKGCTNFRWSPCMSRFLLSFLVNRAKLGQKVNKGFKRHVLMAAAEAVNDKFKVSCTDANVENHLRTIKARYVQIKRLQNLSNTTWNYKERKIIMADGAYSEHIKANQKDEPYLNKRIELYDEMVILCGDDHTFAHDTAKEDHEMDGDDVNIMMNEDVEIEEAGDETQSPAHQVSTSSGSTGKTGGQNGSDMNHYLADKIELLAFQIGELAEAIKSSRKGISSELFSEVMKAEGYDEVSLGKAFDHLHEHENLGKAFLAKNHNLRQAWLSEFFSSGHMG